MLSSQRIWCRSLALAGVGGLAGSDNFLFVSGFEGATALGITNATPLDIRKLTASFAGATFTGDVIGVTGAVQVSSTDLDINTDLIEKPSED